MNINLSSPPPAERGIFRLPYELFHRIVTLATTRVSSNATDYTRNRLVEKYRPFLAPSIVCRRFNSIVTPLLYGDLDIRLSRSCYGAVMSLKALRALHRTLTENPSLYQHTRKLNIDIGSNGESLTALPMLMDLATMLTNTRSLTLSFPYDGTEGDRTDRDLPVLRAVANSMTKIEKFFLFAGSTGPSLGVICENLSLLPHLREFAYYPGSCDMAPLDILQPSSSIKTLDLRIFTGSAEHLQRFLAWPTLLEHFTLGNLFRLDDNPPLSLSMVFSSLAPHKNTLRSLNIGYLPLEGLEGFDLTEFENLEELTISSWTTGSDFRDVGKLIAPRLRKFTWEFPLEESRGSGPLHEFKEPQELWLHHFAAAAIKAESCLSLINVDFYIVDGGGYLPDVYPWDYIDKVADEVRVAGIEVRYPEPILQRDAFYKLRDLEREHFL